MREITLQLEFKCAIAPFSVYRDVVLYVCLFQRQVSRAAARSHATARSQACECLLQRRYCDAIPCLSFPAWSYAVPSSQVCNCVFQQIYCDVVPYVCFSQREVTLQPEVTLQLEINRAIASFNVFIAMLFHRSAIISVRLRCSWTPSVPSSLSTYLSRCYPIRPHCPA